MAIRDKAAAFLGQLGAQVGPTLGQIGSTVGTAVAGTPGKAKAAIDAYGVAAKFIEPPTTGLLGAVGLPQLAQRLQYNLQDPMIAKAIGAGVVGAGALGLGAAGAAISRRGKEKPRMAGRDLGAQLGVQMPIVY